MVTKGAEDAFGLVAQAVERGGVIWVWSVTWLRVRGVGGLLLVGLGGVDSGKLSKP